MGRAKEEWMLREELEPMHDWIEENYGYVLEENKENWEEGDLVEYDEIDWDEAVEAYEDLCEKRQKAEAAFEEQEELNWYIYTHSQKGRFDTQMNNVKELLDVQASKEVKFSLLVMLHGHSVASVESYLASTFIRKVTNSESLIRKLVETDPVFSEMKFTLGEIYEKNEKLKLIVAKYLKKLIFHKIDKVGHIYKNVLQCDFGDVTWLYKAVGIRHHCAHRAGLDKNDEKIEISVDSIRDLVNRSQEFVDAIEAQVKQFSDPEV